MAGPSLLFLVLSTITSWAAATGSGCSANMTTSFDRAYAACSSLPHLSSSLFWSYDSASGNLSIAFVAAPPNPEGWVAWAINPTATGMIGCQTLIAFRQPNGKMVVKTYTITGYGPIKEGKIAFETSDLAAEFTGGAIRMYGSMKLPIGTTTVNQVWQVGDVVANGVPQRHDLKPENTESKGLLNLVKGSTDMSTPASSAAGCKNANALGLLLVVSVLVVCLQLSDRSI